MPRPVPILAVLLAALALAGGGLVLANAASADRLGTIKSKIGRTQGKLSVKQGKARVLTGEMAGLSSRIRRLQGGITVLERRQTRLQVDLDAKRSELLSIQGDLRTARARLGRLRLKLANGRRVLARRLRELYEGERPDLVSVVLSARGFSDLLESGQFISRIGAQDRRVIVAVTRAKRLTTKTVKRLDRLERRQRTLTVAVLNRRNEVARVKDALVGQRQKFAAARAARAAKLAIVRRAAASLKEDLDDLKGEQAAIERKLAARSGAVAAGPIRGNGQLIWPINGTITSPFCESRAWESCHPGLDIAAPTGTPIRAAAAGKVVIAAYTGGYGNYTCVQHTAALTTCYGHQSAFIAHAGQSVARGQVIGKVGSTGHSTGPHLHFETRLNGAVTNPMGYL
jgi:murein DD-endopeptidase MepM/ murein hydrolase activator NlpD